MSDFANVQASIETAKSLPNVFYINSSVYQHEQNTFFRDKWIAIGVGKGIPQPICIKPVNLTGLSMLLVRNQGNNINVFQSVCCHRGMIFVDSAKRLRGPITCPYRA